MGFPPHERLARRRAMRYAYRLERLEIRAIAIMTIVDPDILALAKTQRGPYLAALAAPQDRVPGLLALLALDAELAAIRAKVTEPMLGRIRLQWWSDAMADAVLGRPQSSPVAHPVARALAPLGVSLDDLRALIAAHGFAFADGPASRADIEAYADARGGGLALLMAEVLGVQDAAVRALMRRAGQAWMLAETAREMTRDAARMGPDADVQAMRDLARVLVDEVLSSSLTRAERQQAMPVILQAKLARRLLADPERPFGADVILGLWWAGVTGRY